jgi:hypothetical protein
MKLTRNTTGPVAAQLARIREAVFNEARAVLTAPERMLRLALNEAEALAWQTAYPHLVFPELAFEKVRSLALWNRRQQELHPLPARRVLRVNAPGAITSHAPNSIRALAV